MTTATLTPCGPSKADGASNGSGVDIITLRKAEHRDLGEINNLIAAAMDTWRLADRVKRLSLPLYEYDRQDFEHLHVIVAETGKSTIAGIAAIEAADASECPRGHNAALLHGIYVDPLRHCNGIGTCLLQHMQTIASSKSFDALLVKANPEATSFFETRGFKRFPVEDPLRDYPNRYWKSF